MKLKNILGFSLIAYGIYWFLKKDTQKNNQTNQTQINNNSEEIKAVKVSANSEAIVVKNETEKVQNTTNGHDAQVVKVQNATNKDVILVTDNSVTQPVAVESQNEVVVRLPSDMENPNIVVAPYDPTTDPDYQLAINYLQRAIDEDGFILSREDLLQEFKQYIIRFDKNLSEHWASNQPSDFKEKNEKYTSEPIKRIIEANAPNLYSKMFY